MDESFMGALRGAFTATPALSPAGTPLTTARDEASIPRQPAERARRLLRWLRQSDAWHEAAAGTGGAVG